MPELTNDTVIALLQQCMGSEKKDQIANMYGANYALNVRGHEEEIRDLLLQLPEEFLTSGHSLIGSVFNREGQVWASGILVGQHLLALGMAAGYVDEAFPPRMRQYLPQQVPYYRVDML